MNTLLERIPFGIAETVYSVTLYGSIVLVAIFGACYAPKYNISRKKGFVYTLIIYLLMYVIMFGFSKLERLLGGDGGLSSSRCAIYIILPVLLMAKPLKMPTMQSVDFISPSLLLARWFGKIGCTVFGCCHGFECSWGMYSNFENGYYFPLQPIESAACFIIAVIVILYAKRRNYRAGGRVYALALLLHGIERYLVQFATDDYIVFYGFNEQSIYAILSVLMGLLIFYFADRKKQIS